jgi:hypothetical protein
MGFPEEDHKQAKVFKFLFSRPTRVHCMLHNCFQPWRTTKFVTDWLDKPALMLGLSAFWARPLIGHIKPKMLDLGLKTAIQSEHGIFVIFRNNLNEFWGFYHCTNVSAGSPKVTQSEPAPTSAPMWMDGALMGVSFSSLPVPGITKCGELRLTLFFVLSSAQVDLFLWELFSSPLRSHLPTYITLNLH